MPPLPSLTGQTTTARDEYEALADHMRTLDGAEVDSHLLFNLTVVNVLWRIVSGKRWGNFQIKSHTSP